MLSINKFLFSGFLDDDEKILYIAHRHIFIHLKTLLRTTLFGIAIPLFFHLLFPDAMIFWFLWAVAGSVTFLYQLFDWYYDVWVFTNVGVVNVEWNGFFDRAASRVDYHMIEGISYNVKGFWPTIFNFGDIVLERIGAAQPILLKDARKPRKIEKKFTHFHNHFINERRYSNHENLKELLAEMLHDHVQRTGKEINLD